MVPQTKAASKCIRLTKRRFKTDTLPIASFWRDLNRLWEENTIPLRLAIGVCDGQANTRFRVIHADGDLVLARRKIRWESNLMEIRDVLVLDPTLRGHSTLARQTVLLSDDLAIGIQDVNKGSIRPIDWS